MVKGVAVQDFELSFDSNLMGVCVVHNSWCAMSPRVKTPEGVDQQVDRLIAELEALRDAMKASLREGQA